MEKFTNSRVFGNLVCDKGGISDYWGKRRMIFIKGVGTTVSPFGKVGSILPVHTSLYECQMAEL